MDPKVISAISEGFAPVIRDELNKFKAENAVLKSENAVLRSEVKAALAGMEAKLADAERRFADARANMIERYGSGAPAEASMPRGRLS
jgi:hypothetical protein